jgi:hypothetical protein
MPTIPITKPTNNTWVSAYQDVNFGFNTPIVKCGLASVTNVGGKARFSVTIFGGIVAGCKAKHLFVATGAYAGTHRVTGMAAYSSSIGVAYYDTDTDYVGNQTGEFYPMPNIFYRLWYGYPNQDKYIDLGVHYDNDSSCIISINSYLQSIFANKIQPPIVGFDENMYFHFKVEVIGDTEFNTYLSDLGYTINFLTGYDWSDDLNRWYCVNGTVPHVEFNTDNVNGYVAPMDPILFNDHCIIYSIVAGVNKDRIYNVVSCLGAAASSGIGFMEIEETFIVS